MPQCENDKAPRYTLVYFWVCCRCKFTSNYATTTQCIIADCQHAFDRSHCSIESHKVRE